MPSPKLLVALVEPLCSRSNHSRSPVVQWFIFRCLLDGELNGVDIAAFESAIFCAPVTTSGKTQSDDLAQPPSSGQQGGSDASTADGREPTASANANEEKPETSKKRSRSARAVLNVVVAQISMAVLTAGSFVTTPAQITGLGDAGYGGWLLMVSFISYMRLLDLGTSGGTVKYSAGAIERGDEADLRRVINATSAIFLTAGSVALIGALVLTRVLPRLYPNILGEQATPILLVGVSMAIDLASRTFSATLRAKSLHFVYDSFEILTVGFFKTFLVWYFAYHGGLSYRLLAWLTLIETICRMGFVTIVTFILAPHVRHVNPFKVERQMMAKLTKMGVALSIISIADVVRFQLDAAVIGFFIPERPESITVFGVGTRLTAIAYASIGVIGGILMPSFSGLSETGDKEGVRSLLRGSTLATDVVSSLTLVNIAVLGPAFLQLWLGKPWIPISAQLMRMMMPAYFVALFAEPASGLIVGRGKLRGLTLLTVGEALMNFIISVVLVQFIGIYGVALGTAIPMLFMRGFLFPRLLRNTVGISVRDYYRMHARPTLLTLIYLVLIGPMAFLKITNFVMFFGLCIVSFVLFLILAPLIVPEFRGVLQKYGGKITGRFRRKTA